VRTHTRKHFLPFVIFLNISIICSLRGTYIFIYIYIYLYTEVEVLKILFSLFLVHIDPTQTFVSRITNH